MATVFDRPDPLDRLFGSEPRRRAQELPPDVEDSLVKSLAHGTMSGIGWAAESLDKLGAGVRGTLSYATGGPAGGGLLNWIPFSDTLGITNPEERVYTRDILDRLGITPPNQEGFHPIDNPADAIADVAGFAGDVVLDPLFWVGGPTKAVSKAGELAKASGLMGRLAASDLPAASRAFRGLTWTRKAPMTTSLKDILETLPQAERGAAREAVEQAATKGGYAAEPLMEKPLGGLLNIGPFGKPWATVGTGETAQKVGDWLDKALGRYRWSGPGRYVASLFNNEYKGALTRAAQEEAPRRAMAEAYRTAEAKQVASDVFWMQQKAGLTNKDMDTMASTLLEAKPENVESVISEITQKNPQANPDILRRMYEHWTNVSDEALQRGKAFGTEPFEYDNPYIRYLSRHAKFEGGGGVAGGWPTAFAGYAEKREREPLWGTFKRGTRGINEVITDPDIKEVVLSSKGGPAEIAKTLELKYGPDGANLIDPRYLTSQQKNKIASLTDRLNQAIDEGNALAAQSLQAKIGQIQDAAKYTFPELARRISRIAEKVPEMLDQGLFVEAAPVRAMKSVAGNYRAIEQSKWILDTLTREGIIDPAWLSRFRPVTASGEIAEAGGWKVGQKVKMEGQLTHGHIFGLDPNQPRAFVRWVEPKTGAVHNEIRHLDELTHAKYARPLASIKAAGGEIGDLLKKLGIKHGTEDEGFLNTLFGRMKGQRPDFIEELWSQSHPGMTPTPMALAQFEQANKGKILKALTRARVDEKVFNDFVRTQLRELPTNTAEGLTGALARFTNLWKAGVTARPGFHTRNWLSGQVRNVLDQNWSPGSYSAAKTLLRGETIENPRLRSAPAIVNEARRMKAEGIAPELDPQNLSSEQATDILRKLFAIHEPIGKYSGEHLALTGGLAEQGHVSLKDYASAFPGGLGEKQPLTIGSIFQKIFRPGPEETWNPLKAQLRGVTKGGEAMETTWPLLVAHETAGAYVESLNRGTPFIDMILRGFDPQEAKRVTELAQVAYGASKFTPFERRMSYIWPFYKFARGSTAHTAQELFRHPGGRLAQLLRATNYASGGGGDIVPDYIAQSLSIPIDESTPVIGPIVPGVQRYLTGFGLMHEQDPFGFMGGGVKGALLEAGSRLNPLIKAPVEWTTGRTMFQRGPAGGRNLEDMDPLVGRTIANLTGAEKADFLPSWMEQLLSNSPMAPELTMARQLSDPRKQAVVKLLNALTGIRLSDVSPKAKQAMLDEMVTELMKGAGAKTFERSYFRPEDLADMSPQERVAAMQLQAIKNRMAREHREEAKKAKVK